jgi:hypothetical protein
MDNCWQNCWWTQTPRHPVVQWWFNSSDFSPNWANLASWLEINEGMKEYLHVTGPRTRGVSWRYLRQGYLRWAWRMLFGFLKSLAWPQLLILIRWQNVASKMFTSYSSGNICVPGRSSELWVSPTSFAATWDSKGTVSKGLFMCCFWAIDIGLSWFIKKQVCLVTLWYVWTTVNKKLDISTGLVRYGQSCAIKFDELPRNDSVMSNISGRSWSHGPMVPVLSSSAAGQMQNEPIASHLGISNLGISKVATADGKKWKNLQMVGWYMLVWGFHKWGYPNIAGWLIWLISSTIHENPKIDDLGGVSPWL